MMSSLSFFRRVVCAMALLGATAAPMAQVPPHKEGSICFTPKFWCWVNPPGRPGDACSCPSPYGRVAGRLG